MRLRFVPFGFLVALLNAQAMADAVPSDQSLADIALGQGSSSSAPEHPFILPDIEAGLEKSLSQDLPNGDSVDLYAGYPGSPALGPDVDTPLIAALDGLQAPDGENWLDQGYLAFGVVTAGLSHDDQQLEISRFTSRNAYQSPYQIAHLDSTAMRYTWKPDSNWTLQGSWGSLKSPEYFAPAIVEDRWTASAKYTLPFAHGATWSAMFAWGLKQESIGDNLNAVALDTECKPADGWTVFARGGLEEDNARFANGALSPVGARNAGTASLGAVHDWTLFERLKLGVGGLYAFGLTPQPSGQPASTSTRGAVAYVHLMVH